MNAAPKYRSALTASGVYFAFQALRMVAGFVSMPVLTRALTKEEYGLLNLTFATVGILALVGRLGFSEAIVRFYYERSQQGVKQLREFCGTMLTGALLTGVLVAFVTLAGIRWIAPHQNTARCLRIALLVVVLRSVLGVVYQIYRGQERAVAYSIAQIATRYAALAVAIAILVVSGLTAYEVLVATVVGEGLVAVACLSEFAARGVVGRPRLSRRHFHEAFSYGAPLAVGLYGTFFLDYGDRFLIERFLGLDAVATYSVPYDLASTLAAAVFESLKLALMPVIFRLWESDGRATTSAFVSQVLTYTVAAAIPGIVLFVATSHDLIVLLSSAKYSGSAGLMVYLAPGVFMGELNFLVASGLLISKGTMSLAALTLASSAVNVLLNLVLLPHWGLAGAGAATTVAYGVLMLGTFLVSRRTLDFQVKGLVLAEAALATAVMLAALRVVGQVSAQPAVALLVRGGIGAGVAAVCLSVLDREIRQRTWLRAVRGLKPSLGSVVE